MKKFIFMVVCLLGMATTASAQFANSRGSVSSSDMSGWSGLRVSYHPMSFTDGDDSEDLTGLSIGYTKGFAVSQSTPLFLEAGANLLWSSKNFSEHFEDEYDYYYDDISVKLNMISVNVPINFGYKYALNEGVSIYPYVGVNFRFNVSGKIKVELDDESESCDVFSKDDMDDFEMGDAWKRFNAGWQIGVACHINKFMIAASYGKDFTEIAKKVKVVMPSLTVGLNF